MPQAGGPLAGNRVIPSKRGEPQMVARKTLSTLVGAGMLVVAQQEGILLPPPSFSWASEVDWSPGNIFRDRVKSGADGPEMVVTPRDDCREVAEHYPHKSPAAKMLAVRGARP